jgi:hypothetical protein
MGLPAFLVAATAILSSGGGGGGGGGGEAAPVIPTPDDFATWSAANKPDADFNDQFSSYVNYLNEDQFGLTADERGAYIPEHVVSDYTQKIHATEADMKNDDRSFYDQRLREGTTDFDSWLSNESDDVKNSGYGSQYQRYKNQMNAILNQRPDWMGEDDSSYTTFSSYDPGLFVAGEDYGDFAGSYRSRDDADSAFRNYYAKQIGDFGYGNLIQEDMDNAGYLSAYNEAKARNDYGSLITDLGYGSTYDSSMTSAQLEALWNDVQQRHEYKGLLDEMGYEYDPSDDATSLGYLYNQALAIEDTKAKLEAAQDAYGILEGTYNTTVGEMGELQGEFDTLFGDYGSLTTDYGTLQDTYDTLSTNYGTLEGTYKDTKDALDAKAGEYDTLSGLYDTLTSNYGTMTTDYNTAIGDLGTLQDNYDQLDKDKTALQGTYDELFGDYGTLSSDYDTLSDDFDTLTSTQAKTLSDLEAEQATAAGLRTQARQNATVNFLTESAADKEARMASGFEPLQPPAQQEYTQAMDALGQTALDPNAYAMAPIDFTGGFDPTIFQSTPMGGQMGPDAYGTTDYTDIFAGPQMGLQPLGLDVAQPFNPYFEALNQEYGVDFGLPAIGGQKR